MMIIRSEPSDYHFLYVWGEAFFVAGAWGNGNLNGIFEFELWYNGTDPTIGSLPRREPNTCISPSGVISSSDHKPQSLSCHSKYQVPPYINSILGTSCS